MQRDSLFYYEPRVIDKPLSIISVPTELGSDARGLGLAPAYLYKHGLERMLESLGVEVAQKIDIPCPATRTSSIGQLKNIDEVVDVSLQTKVAATKALAASNVVLALGGDHSMALGTIAASADMYDSLGVIYIDAHPDINTPESTLTSNIHGMIAAARTGFGHPALLELGRPIPPEHFLHIGIKDSDAAEIDALRERHAPVTMFDIATRGLNCALDAIDALARKVDHVWVSMDIDSIDKTFAPAVAMPSECGFTKREILTLAQYIGRTTPLAGLDIVEMLPANDVESKTAKLALELIAQFLGGEWNSYSDYIDSYEKINSTASEEKSRRS